MTNGFENESLKSLSFSQKLGHSCNELNQYNAVKSKIKLQQRNDKKKLRHTEKEKNHKEYGVKVICFREQRHLYFVDS